MRYVVHAEGEPGVATPFAEIVLDRAAKRNALTPGMLAAVAEGLDLAGADARVRAVALLGEGPVFCAGFDLGMMSADAETVRSQLGLLSGCVRRMRRCPKPVVIGAQGAAVAGGCALLTGADVVVADAGCKVGYPVTRLGISPAVSGASLVNAIGMGPARRRLVDPAVVEVGVDGDDTSRVAWAHVIASSPEDVRPRTQLAAQQLGQKPPVAYARTKAWLNEIEGSDDDRWFDAGLGVSLSLVGGTEERSLLASLTRDGGGR